MIKNELLGKITHELKTPFEGQLFAASISNLSEVTNPLRLNNFAYAMRELTRHVLKRLAADEMILHCDWYSNETKLPNGITRRQRLQYAVKGGLDDEYIKNLGLDVDKMYGRLLKAIDKLSKYTHIEVATFNIDKIEVERIVNETLEAVLALFETIENCKQEVVNSLRDHIDKELLNKALLDTIDEIDELATHHYIEEIYTENIEIKKIDDAYIHIEVTGKISCELQWGSNSDLKNDNGALFNDSFPFSCELKGDVYNPGDFHPDLTTLKVDNSSFFE